ncbi:MULTISPECIES: pyridoxal-phosphate-dependent aminotransferase family protein [Kyrpidia]|uniref:(S)-ureidoglycine--glyoxylate transaminase n=1 Tax=Kyrpidia spormannii TaxID=2055160 RepID=A0A6F9ECP5_9BACL|nr:MULTISPECIES: alanine--glyoxylate aminotransferase family protein [Kyrpidia]MCL6576286.1 alanine--glyoxylate aminotransferase family protein [Kyrpidia sp.]CAB3394256.1 (S)-ureidoglycine--glyoxylate transaminase [Kyrpidia spormannii]HHY68516.1 alanine--glyoxylate aminotransferase family protein [Alicyclobacillus sp.]
MNEKRIPQRILLGPGPSDCHPEVLKAMATPLVGHLDPVFLEQMNETMQRLRQVFQTRNPLTLAMSGTGSAGMETVFVNALEPGDRVVIGICGAFGERMVDVASRTGAEVIQVRAPWGKIVDPGQIQEALKSHPRVKAVAVVHAETSTGVLQPLEEIGRFAQNYGALFLVDAVTSLGGVPVPVEEAGIDACYSGTQKCLSAPPGLSPATFSPRFEEALERRKRKVQSWYLDLTMVRQYWGRERFYHHTAPITMMYALHEALGLLLEEGLDSVFRRHLVNGRALQAGLEAMGLKLYADERHRLPQLTSVWIPDGVEDTLVRNRLLNEYGIEIGGGLGEVKGRVWRIGLLGHSSRRRNVLLLLGALEQILRSVGYSVESGIGCQAAEGVYRDFLAKE